MQQSIMATRFKSYEAFCSVANNRRLSNNYGLNEELKDMKKALADKIPG